MHPSNEAQPLRGSGVIAPLELGVIRHRPPVPAVKFFGKRSRRAEFSQAAKPETGIFGHEPTLVAHTCSRAKLLGFLKCVGTPRYNDARRGRSCPWHSQGAPATKV